MFYAESKATIIPPSTDTRKAGKPLQNAGFQ
jgi:hypothetical protein